MHVGRERNVWIWQINIILSVMVSIIYFVSPKLLRNESRHPWDFVQCHSPAVSADS